MNEEDFAVEDALRSRLQEALAERNTLAKRFVELERYVDNLHAVIGGKDADSRHILTTNVLSWPAEERIAFARHLLGPEADALAKRVEELESLMAEWHEALMAQRRFQVIAFEAFDVVNDRLKSEAFSIATRRAGREKT